jgi:hypothetical protein
MWQANNMVTVSLAAAGVKRKCSVAYITGSRSYHQICQLWRNESKWRRRNLAANESVNKLYSAAQCVFLHLYLLA